ncbi:hypothetical protein O6H91_14G024500 [Diphasiastrum complanatum]|uniref:Uncharacterized protein n=1 Tax=Diphasiastrum complanatum TaxID=34168 RepID=A0ACC2BMD0_DIPCM|nr:hypothetical protein O6H91_14G024500 [Diphasiastrum complanatum]
MEESGAQAFIQSLIDAVNKISSIGEYGKMNKKDCIHLTRRLKLLVPLFEEVRDMKQPLAAEALICFEALASVLKDAKHLLQDCHDGSRLYLVELVQCQLKRAKEMVNVQDCHLYEDRMMTLANEVEMDKHHALLEQLAEDLELKTMSDLKQESQALQNTIMEKGGTADDSLELISCVLRKLEKVVASDSLEADTPYLEMARLTIGPSADKSSPPLIPDDFRCPISLELMKDPVIVATGQTYERVCIQKWLDAGHRTCPKTQQILPHSVLTPNYVLRSLIAQWCEANDLELPKKIGCSHGGKSSGACIENPGLSVGERSTVEILVQKLRTGQLDIQRAAAGELRLLAKRSIENRRCIAEAGAIPLLVGLLSTRDPRTQEHAVTALLNLSINDNNKGQIVLAGAIDPIVEILKSGSMEARENAAATLFSLSVVDENKVTIGASGAIAFLVDLLRDGTLRGKKDAATALFNLSIYQGNKPRAVRAGVVPELINLLLDRSTGMIDEALAILAILATHQEGRVAIGQAEAIPVLVDLIKSGSPRNKENAAAVLLALINNDHAHLATTCQLHAIEPLTELAHTGTPRARRKANALLDYLIEQ